MEALVYWIVAAPVKIYFSYISFLLIDGKRQYGLLMLEIEPEEISFYYILALQLGTSLRFLESEY